MHIPLILRGGNFETTLSPLMPSASKPDVDIESFDFSQEYLLSESLIRGKKLDNVTIDSEFQDWLIENEADHYVSIIETTMTISQLPMLRFFIHFNDNDVKMKYRLRWEGL